MWPPQVVENVVYAESHHSSLNEISNTLEGFFPYFFFFLNILFAGKANIKEEATDPLKGIPSLSASFLLVSKPMTRGN